MLMLQEDDKAVASAGSSEATMRADEAPRLIVEGKSEEKNEQKKVRAFLKIHKKEMSRMPKKLQEKLVRCLTKKPRLHNRVYEKQVMINGVVIYGAAASIEECEEKFLNDLTEKFFLLSEGADHKNLQKNVLFSEWAELWFEEVFRPNQKSFETEHGRYLKHIAPVFVGKKIREIMPIDCIRLFNKLNEQGIERTAEGCYGVLKRIFDFAVKSDVISKNPMDSVRLIRHERENGVPLSKEEEKTFLMRIRGMKYEAVFILALYTGLRPCEYETARIEGDFIVAQNRKQKNVKKIVYKKIPITPMLRPYLSLIKKNMPHWKELTADSAKRARWQFQELCPGHRMYDLRTTFATRSQECGASETVVQMWMGHSPRTLLGRVYTKYSDDHLLKEGEKVKY